MDVLYLGELHAGFEHLRAIGSFISGSGIDDSWIAVGWYDGQCLVRPGIRMFLHETSQR